MIRQRSVDVLGAHGFDVVKGFDSPDRTGKLVRVERDGRRTVLARKGLEYPGGVTVAPNGDLYRTNRTTSLAEANGQLLRLRPGRP